MGADDLLTQFKKEIREEIRQEFEQSTQKERERCREEIKNELCAEASNLLESEKQALRREMELTIVERKLSEKSRLELDKSRILLDQKAVYEKKKMKKAEESMLFTAKRLDENWLQRAEHSKRMGFRVGNDGQDEMYERAGISSVARDYTLIAKEILRRADPENDQIKKCFAPHPQPNMELQGQYYGENAAYPLLLKQLSHSESYLSFADAVTVCQDMDLQSRREVFRCIVLHPFYIVSETAAREKVKKELVKFFDRLFTGHVERLLEEIVFFERGTLSLGGDHLLGAKQGAKFKHTDRMLVGHNLDCWEQITDAN